MSYTVTGQFRGFAIELRWDDAARRLVGDDLIGYDIAIRARRPVDLTPTGPTLERPDPSLPGHALALLSEVMDIERVTGDVPEYPEGFKPDDFAVPAGGAA